MARDKLGEIRQRILKRYNDLAEPLRNYSPSDLVSNEVEKRIWKILQEFGIDYPRKFDLPPPDIYVVARQGTHCLDPAGSTDGGSPPLPTDVKCMTYKARDGGFLIIDHFDLIMEDPIADAFTLAFKFDGQGNSPAYQRSSGDSEIGHWKFNRVVLIDGEEIEICVTNPDAYASGCFSFESRIWSL